MISEGVGASLIDTDVVDSFGGFVAVFVTALVFKFS